MPTGQKQAREGLQRARDRQHEARVEMARVAAAAKAAGVPVREIADLLGFKTRKSVYDLIERGY